PRYLFTNLTRLKTARGQEQFLLDNIQERYKCQTVRTVCRLPRIFRMIDARNVKRFEFDSYVETLGIEEQETLRLAAAAMKVLLLTAISPKRIAALGGLIECQSGVFPARVWCALVCHRISRGGDVQPDRVGQTERTRS